MGKDPGPKIQKMGVQRAPKMRKSPRSKILSLGAITGYGMAPKIGNSTGVKFEFGAPGISPTKFKAKMGKSPGVKF
jgi:trans-2-enoyl-CoA reductase